MKGELIKISENTYRLEVNNSPFYYGHTSSEFCDLPNKDESYTHKLSLRNCHAIELSYDLDELGDEYYKQFDNLPVIRYNAYVAGFQKALELMGDKKFSEEQLREAFFHVQNEPTFDVFKQSLQQTEWDVEIIMEKYGYCEGCRKAGMWHCAHADTCGNAVELERPLLDAYDCLILKRT
jgi:hypothetical protein